MSGKQFDAVKWGFWLVAFVVGAHVIAALAAEFSCIWHTQVILTGDAVCKPTDKLMEVLASALAAALAFAGGQKMGSEARRRRIEDEENEE